MIPGYLIYTVSIYCTIGIKARTFTSTIMQLGSAGFREPISFSTFGPFFYWRGATFLFYKHSVWALSWRLKSPIRAIIPPVRKLSGWGARSPPLRSGSLTPQPDRAWDRMDAIYSPEIVRKSDQKTGKDVSEGRQKRTNREVQWPLFLLDRGQSRI